MTKCCSLETEQISPPRHQCWIYLSKTRNNKTQFIRKVWNESCKLALIFLSYKDNETLNTKTHGNNIFNILYFRLNKQINWLCSVFSYGQNIFYYIWKTNLTFYSVFYKKSRNQLRKCMGSNECDAVKYSIQKVSDFEGACLKWG